MTLYDVGQYCFRLWLTAWRNQASHNLDRCWLIWPLDPDKHVLLHFGYLKTKSLKQLHLIISPVRSPPFYSLFNVLITEIRLLGEGIYYASCNSFIRFSIPCRPMRGTHSATFFQPKYTCLTTSKIAINTIFPASRRIYGAVSGV